MVVYHGTSERGLTVFDLTQARQNADIPSFFFTTEREEAEGYGGNVIEAFLNIRNPTEKPNANMRGSEVRQRLEAEGFDGTITEDGYSTEYAAFSPTQIKSATGNTGEYGADNPNIFHQRSAATRFAFEKRIDELYAGAKPNKEGVRALDEGDVLTITGYGNMPVVINERHAVDDGQYNHGLTAEDWKKVPEWLDNPVAVFERARDGHLTLIAPEKKNGRAIVMALEPAVAAPEGYTGEARRHIVLTVYPKDSGVLSLRSEIERGEVVPVYADQKKNSPGFFDGSGVRYPGSVTELRTANRNIKTDADLVKYRRSRDAQGFGQKGKNLGSFQPSTQTFTFSKDANLSTFLHETGHFFLEMESRIANRLVAKAESGETLTAEEQRMLSDNRVLLDWFGVQDLNAWNAMTVEEQTSHHERFAQAFEKYLFEGKAPSVELQGTFQRFMAWLLDVYKSWSNISSEPLSDVVRGVFDRMLATDEQIEMARASREIKPMFESAEQTGVSPEVWERYQADNEALIEAAKETQRSRGLRDMKWLHNKVSAEVTRLQREAKALRRELHAEVTVDVMNRPVYQAWAFLTRKMTDSDRIAAPEKGTGESVDPSRDSMFTAIAKLGGLNRAQAQAEWGIDKREKIENPAFGKPVLRAKEGRSIDEMARALAELGYLPTDENGKVDVHDFEQAFHNELIGSPQYSTALDPASLMESRAGEQIVNPAALGAGRLDMGSLREMYGDAGQYATRRTAANFKDAKDAALSFVNKPLTNRKSGMVATVSGNSIGKMLNTKAVGKSSSPETHARVVANLDVLFERAVLGWSRPDKNSDINIPAIHRFFTAVHTETGVHLVKLTVKEHLSGEQGNKIYSVEAVEINEESPAVKWVNSYAEADSLGTSSIRPSGDVLNLAQQIQNVNRSDSALIVALLKARHMTAETGGVHPDLLAEVMPWGYDSGDALIRELVVAEPPRDVIEAETDARMLEEHGELATPEAIEQSANEALTNSALIRMTATEFVALDNALGKGVLNREEFLARQRMVMAAARGFADALINRSSVRDIVPSRFYAAARKARAESEKAFRNGDIQAAAEAKRREIFQNQIKTHETRSGLI
ncbi:MAG: hypothetical protein LBE32_01290 [Burkholderiales bacterium]|nr:hypothetical protein [Burkholderiales bacterium]